MKRFNLIKPGLLFMCVSLLQFQCSLGQSCPATDSLTKLVQSFIQTVEQSGVHGKVYQGFFDALNNPEYLNVIVAGLSVLGSSNPFDTASSLQQSIQSAYDKLTPRSFFEAYGSATEQLLLKHGIDTENNFEKILQVKFDSLKNKEALLGPNPTTLQYLHAVVENIVEFLAYFKLLNSTVGDDISKFFSEKLIALKGTS